MQRLTYTVTEAVHRGDIPSLVIGHRIVIARSAVARLLGDHDGDAPPPAA